MFKSHSRNVQISAAKINIISETKKKKADYLLLFLGSYHAIDTEDDEGDGEDLAHIKWEGGFEGFLNLLGIFDEEAEGEDIRQTEAKIPASADLSGIFL